MVVFPQPILIGVVGLWFKFMQLMKASATSEMWTKSLVSKPSSKTRMSFPRRAKVEKIARILGMNVLLSHNNRCLKSVDRFLTTSAVIPIQVQILIS